MKSKKTIIALSLLLSTTTVAENLKMSLQLTLNNRVTTSEDIQKYRASTLIEVYESALNKNLPYLINDRNFQAVFTRIEQAKSKLRPQVNGEVKAGFNTSSNQTAMNYLSSSVSINATWILYNKSLKLDVNLSELDVQIAEKQLILARQELMNMVAKAYFDLILKVDKQKLIAERVNEISILEKAASTQVEVGVANENILSTIRSEKRKALNLNNKALQELDLAQSKFEEDFGVQFKPYLTARQISIPGINHKTHSEWLQEAEENSLNFQIQRIALEMSRKNIEKAKAITAPTLTLEGSITSSRNPIQQSDPFLSSNTQNTRGNSIFLKLNIPFWDGGYRSAVTKEQTARAEASEYATELSRKNARALATSALSNYNTSVRSINSQRQLIKDSITQLNTYKIPESNVVDILGLQQELFTLKYELSEYNVKALESYIQLKLATSGLDSNDLALLSTSLVKLD